MKNIVCHICNVEMNETKKDIKTGWGKYKITISGVKGYECPICGEIIYSSEDVKMIQGLSRGFAELKNEEHVLLNVSETADLLRVSHQTIYNMIHTGKLSAVKTGREWRFNRKDIQGILNPQEYELVAARNSGEKISENDKKILERELRDM